VQRSTAHAHLEHQQSVGSSGAQRSGWASSSSPSCLRARFMRSRAKSGRTTSATRQRPPRGRRSRFNGSRVSSATRNSPVDLPVVGARHDGWSARGPVLHFLRRAVFHAAFSTSLVWYYPVLGLAGSCGGFCLQIAVGCSPRIRPTFEITNFFWCNRINLPAGSLLLLRNGRRYLEFGLSILQSSAIGSSPRDASE
jgi:hypothetical protein